MKFQNSSIHSFKVMLCIKKRDERTDGRTNNPEAICPSNFFEVGGINIKKIIYTPIPNANGNVHNTYANNRSRLQFLLYYCLFYCQLA